MPHKSPLVLLILDGWGYREDSEYNAIAKASTPQWDQWWETCPHIMLEASGKCVGLPDAQMGNSEVGHMHIGAGRIIPQDFTRINQAIESGAFASNPLFNQMIEEMKQRDKAIHVMGLFSPGGVHSHEAHLFEFIKLCAAKSFDRVYLHLFLDGRDTPPKSALESFERLNAVLEAFPVATIASISGRYYAMDRDQRWQRVEPVYRLLTQNESQQQFKSPEEALHHFYEESISDEFIPPTKIGEGKAIESGDSVFFFNFRSDRARQLSHAFLDDEFKGFKRERHPSLTHFISMTRYSRALPTESAFPPPELTNTLGEVLANQGLSQLRIAETEKYAHVTFFLNGGSEHVYPQEERHLIPSPKVATYDLQPEMSAPALTDAIVKAIHAQQYDVIICNYANADMVGHTGNFSATIRAIECLDQCMSRIWEALRSVKGMLLITADHGNAELMYDTSTQQVQTAHTNLPVPLVYVGGGWAFKDTHGSLIDIAPTMLTLLNIRPPEEMTGRSLMVNAYETSN
ncbi:2,3-bisphosphoglycerate-independent phosphoglycerate mutase [Legionella impletisoli]|uniref:2,3-bisphosphoglycerate-independent phosphoglycerate mutase n=1 Tax=Legionella impletisoli TaxID=343510 RepID=A0A917JW30_9GAMM|nr:2,3-bisphosphoglycerate-independent phosphoglycerate mutase [Legionella impletisoli]GGI89772.1 2,3-bisphosphoglycerate-independent phosphoglycerate mutase [Legionella impletisoli]